MGVPRSDGTASRGCTHERPAGRAALRQHACCSLRHADRVRGRHRRARVHVRRYIPRQERRGRRDDLLRARQLHAAHDPAVRADGRRHRQVARRRGPVLRRFNRWLSRVPGGLGVADVPACGVFAAMCGSSPATCSAIGSSGVADARSARLFGGARDGPDRGRRHARDPDAAVADAHSLRARRRAVDRQLFMAGVGPGLVLTAMFIAWTIFQFRRDRLRATAAAAAGGPALQVLEHYTWARRVRRCRASYRSCW